jgi:hypothetical protein
MITEIRTDASTLPQDGEKVKFHIPSDGWKEGVYNAEGQMFKYDGDKFHYAWEASDWESLEIDPKWNIAVVKKLVTDSEKYPVKMRIVADLHRRGIVKSESDLHELLYKSGHFDSMDGAVKNGLYNEYQNIFMKQKYGTDYDINNIPKP